MTPDLDTDSTELVEVVNHHNGQLQPPERVGERFSSLHGRCFDHLPADRAGTDAGAVQELVNLFFLATRVNATDQIPVGLFDQLCRLTIQGLALEPIRYPCFVFEKAGQGATGFSPIDHNRFRILGPRDLLPSLLVPSLGVGNTGFFKIHHGLLYLPLNSSQFPSEICLRTADYVLDDPFDRVLDPSQNPFLIFENLLLIHYLVPTHGDDPSRSEGILSGLVTDFSVFTSEYLWPCLYSRPMFN